MAIQIKSRSLPSTITSCCVVALAVLFGPGIDARADEWFNNESPPIGNFRVLFPTDAIAPDSYEEGLGFDCSDGMPVAELRHQHEQFTVTVMKRAEAPAITDVWKHLDAIPDGTMNTARELIETGQVRQVALSAFDTGRICCSGYPGIQTGVYRCTSRGGITSHGWTIVREIVTDDQLVILSYCRNRTDRYTDIFSESEFARAQHRAEQYFSTFRLVDGSPKSEFPWTEPQGLWLVVAAAGYEKEMLESLVEIQPDGTVLLERKPWGRIEDRQLVVTDADHAFKDMKGQFETNGTEVKVAFVDQKAESGKLTLARYGGCIAPSEDTKAALVRYSELVSQAKDHESVKWADDSIAEHNAYRPISIGDHQVIFSLIEFVGHLRQGAIHEIAWNTMTTGDRQTLLRKSPDIAHLRRSFLRVREAAPQ